MSSSGDGRTGSAGRHHGSSSSSRKTHEISSGSHHNSRHVTGSAPGYDASQQAYYSSHSSSSSSRSGHSKSTSSGSAARPPGYYNSRSGYRGQQPQQAQVGNPVAPATGQIRSGHMEVDTLYGSGGASGGQGMVVNSMNAPNNSTMQCGCENIDCPFCNLMLSVQMKDQGY